MKRELLGSRLHIDYVEVTNCVTSSWYYICIIMKGCFIFYCSFYTQLSPDQLAIYHPWMQLLQEA